MGTKAKDFCLSVIREALELPILTQENNRWSAMALREKTLRSGYLQSDWQGRRKCIARLTKFADNAPNS